MTDKTEKKTASSKRLTMEMLKSKTLPERTFSVDLGGESFDWKIRAINGQRMDALQTKYPPTKAQRERGAVFNIDKFAPALIAACSIEPELNEDEAKELWTSEEWTTGELNSIFTHCTNLCMNGFEIPPTERG